jgi:RNA polymerase sigma factor (sigma-70 family)
MKKDKRIIENINQETGVNISQLHEQCHYLITTIPNIWMMHEHDINDAINDAILSIWDKMQQGHVNKTDYQQFKDYLYITLKNNVYKIWDKKQQRRNLLENGTIICIENPEEWNKEIDSIDLDKDEKQYQLDILKKALAYLPKHKQSWLNDYIDGMTPAQVQKKYNLTKMQFHNLQKSLRLRIRKIINGENIMTYRNYTDK